jgi:hypothetical protein
MAFMTSNTKRKSHISKENHFEIALIPPIEWQQTTCPSQDLLIRTHTVTLNQAMICKSNPRGSESFIYMMFIIGLDTR